MGSNECSQPASKSSWDSQYFGDISMVLKMAHFPPGHNELKWVTNNGHKSNKPKYTHHGDRQDMLKTFGHKWTFH